jgi:hypothetical protein
MSDADWDVLLSEVEALLFETFPPGHVAVTRHRLLAGVRFVCTLSAPLRHPVSLATLHRRLVDLGIGAPRIELGVGGGVAVTVMRPSAVWLRRWGERGVVWAAKLVLTTLVGGYLVSLALSHPSLRSHSE